MNKLPLTVSVGIPAYNEENTIKTLLQQILKQQTSGFILKEVLVVSDGSTDHTAKEIKSIQDTRVHLVNDHKRLGKSARLNQIFSFCKSDILILCDADILITDSKLFLHILKNTDIAKAGVAVPNFTLVKPTNFLEKCLHLSVYLQNDLRKKWNNGNNYLSFRGAFLVLDGTFARRLKLPQSLVNNDAYIYFKALQDGYIPQYMFQESVTYKTPSTFHDYRNQSSRYQASYEELSNYVHIDKNEYTIPPFLYLKCVMYQCIHHPIYFTGYILLRYTVRILKNRNLDSRWKMATSTKTL